MNPDRAVSTVVGFVLTLGITSLLVIGLLVGTTGFVDDQRRDTARDEMEVLGQQIAADLAASDRLVRGGGITVEIERTLPNEVTGLSYRINVASTSDGATITLSTQNPSVTVEVSVRTMTDVGGTTLNGGDVEIVYTGSALEVQNG
jgi:hypothetical protein